MLRFFRWVRRLWNCFWLNLLQFAPVWFLKDLERTTTNAGDNESKAIIRMLMSRKDKIVRFWVFWPSWEFIKVISAENDGEFKSWGRLF